MRKPVLIVITGPTASGKSALAIELAKQLSTEVISADSRQIYQGIPIVTSMPTVEEMQGVRHHLMDILPLEAYYSASEFERDALRLSSELFSKSGVGIVCRGSMMYVDVLCNGIDDLPTVPQEIRDSLMDEWRQNGDNWLLERLHELDPWHYERVDRKNMKRVFHAVEISLTSGKAYSSLITGERKRRDFEIIKICLDGDRDKLFGRINSRVDRMVDMGLENEARRVYPLRHLNSLNTVGLKEMFAWFDGTMEKDSAIARIKKNTRVYARKQLTWHKRDSGMTRLNFDTDIKTNTRHILDKVCECQKS